MGTPRMTTKMPCEVCHRTHRTSERRIGSSPMMTLCVSCHTALVQFHQWKRATPDIAAQQLTNVYINRIVTPYTKIAANGRKTTP